MKKREYIEMLMQDVATMEEADKRLYSDVIDCIDIALSGESDNFEVDEKLTVESFYEDLSNKARKEKLRCIGPFEAAEMFAKKLGTKYVRLTKRETVPQDPPVVNLEDFI